MRRLSRVILASGLTVLAVASCFDDPTSSLRNGAARLQLSRSAVVVHTGDSAVVEARVLDEQGNPLQFSGATWSSGDASTASVTLDENAPIGSVYSRAFIKGVAAPGGVTNVTVEAAGLSATFRVTVLSATYAGGVAVTGTASADTIVVLQPPPAPALSVVVSGGDTLTLTAPSTMTFDITNAGVTFGTNSAYVLSRTASSLKVLARAPFAGRATVTNMVFTGTAETGPIAIASINTDSLLIVRARFRGTVAVGNSAFGPNTQVTITAPAGVTFNTSGTTATGVVVGTTSAIVLLRTSTTITAILGATVTGRIKLTSLNVAGAAVDSLRTPGNSTVNASFFPGTFANGAGRLLDTVKVTGAGQATFTTSGTGASQVTINGQQAFILRRTADSIYAIAKLPGTAQFSVSNVIVAGTTIPSLSTQSTLAVSTTTAEANEPGNDSRATATALAFTGATDTIVVYGTLDCRDDGTNCAGGIDIQDYYSFTTSTTTNLRAILTWFGNGAAGGAAAYGSDPDNPDFDVILCKESPNPCTYGAAGSIGASSGAGQGLSQPEIAATSTAQAAGNFNVRVLGFVTRGPTTYQLRILRF